MVGKEQNKNMSESLENFTSIAKEDHQRAKMLFFSEAFKEEFMKDRQTVIPSIAAGEKQRPDSRRIFIKFKAEISSTA